MRVLSMSAVNFLSYQELHVRCGARGVVLVTGSNGEGKSAAVVELLSWILFGATIRGLTGDEVIHDPDRSGKGKGCRGSVLISTDQGEITIIRYRKDKAGKNNVEIIAGGKPTSGPPKVMDDKIGQLLGGLTWETFKITSIFGQGQLSRFSSGTDRERKAVLDEMLHIGRYADAREVAAARLLEARKQQTALTLQKQQTEASLARHQEEREQLGKERQLWQERHNLELGQLGQSWQDAQTALISAPQPPDVAAFQATVAQLDAQAQAATASSNQEMVAATQRVSDIQAALQQAKHRLSLLQAQAYTAKVNCDRSEQISAQDADRQRATFERNMAQTTATLASLETSAEPLLAQLDELEQPIRHHCPTCKVDLEAAVAAGLTGPETLAQLRYLRTQMHAGKVAEIERLGTSIERQQIYLTQLQEIEQARQVQRAAELTNEILTRTSFVSQAPEIEVAEEIVRNNERDLRFASSTLDQAREKAAKAAQSLEAAEVARARRNLTEAMVLAESHRRTITVLQAAATRAAALLETAQKAEDPYARALQASADQVARVHHEQAEVVAALAPLEQQCTDLAFWVNGFGPAGIRSLLLDEVLPALNRHARRFAQALGAGRLTVRFDTESALKSGEIRDRFEPIVQLDHGAGTYAGLSGGWQRRVDLVELLALRAVAAELHGGLDLLVLDEPFESVDDLGLESAVTLTHEVARDLGTVFVISHKPELQARFPQRLAVTATAGVSQIKEVG